MKPQNTRRADAIRPTVTDAAGRGGRPLDAASIRTRILLLTLAVLLPATAAVAWLLVLDLRHARSAAYDRVTILTDETQAGIERFLDGSQLLLARLADRPMLRAMDARSCNTDALDSFAATPAVIGLELRTASGAPVCAVDLSGTPRTPGQARAWHVEAVQARGMTVSKPYIDERTSRNMIEFDHPVRSADGTLQGVVVAQVDLLILGARLFAGAPRDAVLSVVDSSGAWLLRSKPVEASDGNAPGAGSTAPLLVQTAGFIEATGNDGIQRLFAYSTLRNVGWRVAAGLPSEQIFAAYRESARRTVALGTVVLLFALTMAWLLGESIARPIAMLRHTARQVASGDSHERVHETGPTEIRAVMHDFNQMLDALTLSRARLQSVFDSASEAIVTTDSSHRIVLANAAAARTFGMPIERLLRSSLDDLMPARFRLSHHAAIERFGAAPSARAMGDRPGLVALRADGTEFPIEASISHAGQGEQRIYVAVLHDLTERQRTVAALLATKTTLRAALASMSDAVCICDAEGGLVETNQAFTDFHRLGTGVTTAAALMAAIELESMDARPVPSEQWPHACALRGEAGNGVELLVRRRGLPSQWTGCFNFAPLRDSDGRVFGCVVTARDVTAVRRTKRELETSHAALRRLVRALDRAQEDERKRIARELHDDLQQTLAAIAMESVTAGQTVAANSSAVSAALQRIDELAGAALQSTRRIIDGMRPQILEDLGLVAALQSLSDQFARRSGMRCTLEVECPLTPETRLPPDIATCLYRVAQESLNNIAKHARAASVSLRLDQIEGRAVRLQVCDDGCGIGPAALTKPSSFGVLGMHERLLAVGGQLRIETRAGARNARRCRSSAFDARAGLTNRRGTSGRLRLALAQPVLAPVR